MDRRDAEVAAAKYLANDSFVISTDLTREEEFGWVIFYQSREYVETGDPSTMLAGNAPLVVRREDGAVQVTGTARPLEDYLAGFRTAGQ